VEDFPLPQGTTTRTICAESGMLATDHCVNTSDEIYDEGAEPTEYCTAHPGRPLVPGQHPFWHPDSLERDLRELDAKPGKEAIHI